MNGQTIYTLCLITLQAKSNNRTRTCIWWRCHLCNWKILFQGEITRLSHQRFVYIKTPDVCDAHLSRYKDTSVWYVQWCRETWSKCLLFFSHNYAVLLCAFGWCKVCHFCIINYKCYLLIFVHVWRYLCNGCSITIRWQTQTLHAGAMVTVLQSQQICFQLYT
jgi:hypothetical protein